LFKAGLFIAQMLTFSASVNVGSFKVESTPKTEFFATKPQTLPDCVKQTGQELTNFNILIYNILCYLPAAGRVGALVAILLFRLFGAGSKL
jgi:hypothetical protein